MAVLPTSSSFHLKCQHWHNDYDWAKNKTNGPQGSPWANYEWVCLWYNGAGGLSTRPTPHCNIPSTSMAAMVFTGLVPLTTCIQGNKTNIFSITSCTFWTESSNFNLQFEEQTDSLEDEGTLVFFVGSNVGHKGSQPFLHYISILLSSCT
jgi:hypothetical protein